MLDSLLIKSADEFNIERGHSLFSKRKQNQMLSFYKKEKTKSNQKSMVLRVTDKELLSKTGGIIQGMSGSPIVQDNKIVGAVTHVFVNDPTKGFGVYLDWMLEQ